MKYTTIAEFDGYSIIQPVNAEYYIERSVTRQRKRKNQRKKEIELFWSAVIAGIISVGTPFVFIVIWLVFGY